MKFKHPKLKFFKGNWEKLKREREGEELDKYSTADNSVVGWNLEGMGCKHYCCCSSESVGKQKKKRKRGRISFLFFSYSLVWTLEGELCVLFFFFFSFPFFIQNQSVCECAVRPDRVFVCLFVPLCLSLFLSLSETEVSVYCTDLP